MEPAKRTALEIKKQDGQGEATSAPATAAPKSGAVRAPPRTIRSRMAYMRRSDAGADGWIVFIALL